MPCSFLKAIPMLYFSCQLFCLLKEEIRQYLVNNMECVLFKKITGYFIKTSEMTSRPKKYAISGQMMETSTLVGEHCQIWWSSENGKL